MPSEAPLVSVILPTHNSAAWIQASIESVLQQSYRNLELIVVDDGSSDQTIALVTAMSKADSRLMLVPRQACSGGPATPRNDGIELATGDYLAFIDSDDLWHPKKLELQLRAMLEGSFNFLSTLHIPFQSASPTIVPVDENIHIYSKGHRELICKNWVITSSALINRSLFNDVRFNQQNEYIGVEDYVAWLQLHQNPSIKSGVLASPLVFYRLRKGSISASKIMMAKKIYYLLSNYTYKGRPLGLVKYYYFMTYAVSAITNRLWKN